MKNYESPTIESVGGAGEIGVWFKTVTFVASYNVVAAAAAAIISWAAIALISIVLSPLSETQE